LPLTLKPLVTAFFENGGMQLQVSCLSREEILDAMAHPERHGSLVVRIGGFSEYFTRLSPALQQTVLERTEH
jgi:formate C-acetyltransferase